jgi:hypothetical protein
MSISAELFTVIEQYGGMTEDYLSVRSAPILARTLPS